MTNAEIDALVAERVMGMKLPEGKIAWGWGINSPPRFSTDITEAWKVVEKLFERQGFALVWDGLQKWTASFALGDSQAATAPMAICLAALRSVGVTVEA